MRSRAFAQVDVFTTTPYCGNPVAVVLDGAGLAPDRYVAAQGTALGRAGRVHVARDGADIWVGWQRSSLATTSFTQSITLSPARLRPVDQTVTSVRG